MMEEKRRALRRRTLKGARVVFNNRQSSIDCVVRNLSDDGARLDLVSSIGVPDRLLLVFDDGCSKRSCEVKWRKAKSIGLLFVETEKGKS